MSNVTLQTVLANAGLSSSVVDAVAGVEGLTAQQVRSLHKALTGKAFIGLNPVGVIQTKYLIQNAFEAGAKTVPLNEAALEQAKADTTALLDSVTNTTAIERSSRQGNVGRPVDAGSARQRAHQIFAQTGDDRDAFTALIRKQHPEASDSSIQQYFYGARAAAGITGRTRKVGATKSDDS